MVFQSILGLFAIALIAVSVNADNDSSPTSNAPISSCGEVTATVLNDFEQKCLVDAINSFRRVHTNKPSRVEWDQHLSELAQKRANQCSDSIIPDGYNSSGIYQLVYSGPYAEYPYEVLSHRIWTDEKILNPPKNSPYSVLNRVGCGRVMATKGNYLVCNFAQYHH